MAVPSSCITMRMELAKHFTDNTGRLFMGLTCLQTKFMHAEIEVNGTSYQVQLGQEIKRPQTPKLVRYTPPTPLKPPQPLNTPGLSIVKAPLPGTIIALMVQPGSQVKPEEPILVLEAMKMENNIFAEKAGSSHRGCKG